MPSTSSPPPLWKTLISAKISDISALVQGSLTTSRAANATLDAFDGQCLHQLLNIRWNQQSNKKERQNQTTASICPDKPASPQMVWPHHENVISSQCPPKQIFDFPLKSQAGPAPKVDQGEDGTIVSMTTTCASTSVQQEP